MRSCVCALKGMQWCTVDPTRTPPILFFFMRKHLIVRSKVSVPRPSHYQPPKYFSFHAQLWGQFLPLRDGFKPSSRYNSDAPVCYWFSHSHCHATSFDLRICRFGLLRGLCDVRLGVNSLTCTPSRFRVRYFISLYALVPRDWLDSQSFPFFGQP